MLLSFSLEGGSPRNRIRLVCASFSSRYIYPCVFQNVRSWAYSNGIGPEVMMPKYRGTVHYRTPSRSPCETTLSIPTTAGTGDGHGQFILKAKIDR